MAFGCGFGRIGECCHRGERWWAVGDVDQAPPHSQWPRLMLNPSLHTTIRPITLSPVNLANTAWRHPETKYAIASITMPMAESTKMVGVHRRPELLRWTTGGHVVSASAEMDNASVASWVNSLMNAEAPSAHNRRYATNSTTIATEWPTKAWTGWTDPR